MRSNLKAALWYARTLGWKLFPEYRWDPTNAACTCGADDCSRPGNHPIVGVEPTSDQSTLTRLWTAEPTANIGLDLELSGLIGRFGPADAETPEIVTPVGDKLTIYALNGYQPTGPGYWLAGFTLPPSLVPGGRMRWSPGRRPDKTPPVHVPAIPKLEERKPEVAAETELLGVEFSEILESEPTPPDWQVEHLFERGDVIVLGAPPAHGKSYLALDLTLSIASGGRVWGGFDVKKPGRVAYLDAEMSLPRVRGRTHRMAAGMGLEPRMIDGRAHLWSRGPVYTLDEDERFDLLLKQLQIFAGNDGIDLIIFDTQRRFMHGEENDSGSVSRFFQRAAELRQLLGRPTNIFLHHNRKVSKDQSPEAGERLRGSIDILGAPDHVFIVDSKTQDGRLHIVNPKHRQRDLRPFLLRMDGWQESAPTEDDWKTPLRIVYEGEAAAALTEGQNSQSRVVQFLESQPERRAFKPDIVAGCSPLSTSSVERALRALKGMGLVASSRATRTSPALYWLTDPDQVAETSLLNDSF